MASESTSSIENPPLIRISSKSNFHFLEIDYSKSKHLPIGERISSPELNAGGFDWVVHFYPRGQRLSLKSHVALYLRLVSEAKDFIAKYSFKAATKTINLLPIVRDAVAIFGGKNKSRGHAFAREKIESSIIENDILVISTSIKVLTEQKCVVNHPHGLCEHIEKLWEKGKRFDMTFDVEGENISAHRFMLAARSPVFEAKLFGPMAKAKMECIKIDEMKAEVFKALLELVYTDTVSIDEFSDDETLSIELLQGLFMAADRYALEKLILLYVEKLENNLTVDTVATTLALADRHSNAELKNKCLHFVSDPEKFSLVAITDGYINIVQGASSLFTEISKKVKGSSRLVNRFAKKPRTS